METIRIWSGAVLVFGNQIPSNVDAGHTDREGEVKVFHDVMSQGLSLGLRVN